MKCRVACLVVALAMVGCGGDPTSAPDADTDGHVQQDAQPQADSATIDGATDAAGATCGNGTVEGSEACDDGNLVDGDGCESDCTPTPCEPHCPVKRVVLAGDSWSTGLITPVREGMDASGFSAVELTWENTANAGSTALGWISGEHPPAAGGGQDFNKPVMLDALDANLDASPVAEVLILVIGGNDLNRECADGLGTYGTFMQTLIFDSIEDDIQALVDYAQTGRPDLKVVLVGYDYFHFEFLMAFGLSLDGFDTTSYNEAVVELGRRKRAIADRTPGVEYAHNFGILQHVYGDTVHPPFSRPNPMAGYPEYGPGVAPMPGFGPAYQPYPGGFYTYPAPLDQMPDGIHPSPDGFRTIFDNVLTQGLASWLSGAGWAP